MSPMEHYDKAEELLRRAESGNTMVIGVTISLAQVHATLAAVDPVAVANHKAAVARLNELRNPAPSIRHLHHTG